MVSPLCLVHLKLSDVSLGIRTRYSPVADEDSFNNFDKIWRNFINFARNIILNGLKTVGVRSSKANKQEAQLSSPSSTTATTFGMECKIIVGIIMPITSQQAVAQNAN